jgi:hypothetical protein
MSNEKTPTTDGNQAAVEYVNQQLDQARSSLGRTKLVAVIVILLVLTYMTFVTKGILGELEPTQAAQTARGVMVAQLSEQGETLVEALRERIPQIMHDLPDKVLERIPNIRSGIEDRIEGQLRNYATITAGELEPEFDTFLREHKDDIQAFLDASQNLDELREDLNPDLDRLLNDYLASVHDGQESLKEKFDQSRTLLNGIADQTKRLATSPDLTEREKQTRRAIAVLLAKADFKLYDATRDHDPEDDPEEKTTTTEE